ncbi:SNF2 helicase associated domain-containing protein, partial [Pedobacter sp.]|uniref:SNF2 helicase associated domain-containing protein n=1 Tax=Pedobacter sp. TaxID=1411316 RepID=UPI003D7F24AC
MSDHEIVIESFNAAQLDPAFIARHSAQPMDHEVTDLFDVRALDPEIGYCMFACRPGTARSAYVTVSLSGNTLRLGCDCQERGDKLCVHQTQVLYNVMRRAEIRLFFDPTLRHEKIKEAAYDYGLAQEADLDNYFKLEYNNRSITVSPKDNALIKVNQESRQYLNRQLLPTGQVPVLNGSSELGQRIVVFKKHKYYGHFIVELYEGASSQQGKLKNPLVLLNPLDAIWKTTDPDELKFYTAVAKFQHQYDTENPKADMEALKALVKNPFGLRFYELKEAAKTVGTTSLIPIHITPLPLDIRMAVNQRDAFYEVTGQLFFGDRHYDLEKLQVKFQYFLQDQETMYLIDNPDFLRMIAFFKKHDHKILIHQSKFEEFQRTILSKLEHHIQITYAYLKPATKKQLEENSFNLPNEKIIYLSDEGDHILITPVVRYGNVEVPVLSKRTIYALDSRGKPFTVARDEAMELQITSMLMRQHPHFEEQLQQHHFYLHRSRFLDNGWFLDAFEEWQKMGIKILGFKELSNNKLSAHRAKIDIKVLSGLDWFETGVELTYGKEKISLKYLHQAIRNKSKFVQLGDGTLGILPDEWIGRFTKYFHAGEVQEEMIRTPKVNFSGVEELYEAEFMTAEVKQELATFKERLSDFQKVKEVKAPKGLKTVLRTYQQQGLNWLNFLDEFGFGGCLAD